MKKILYTLFFILLSSSFFAQNLQDEKNYHHFYKNHKNKDNIIGLSLPISLANLFIDSKEKELKQLISRGKKLRVLVFDKQTKEIKKDLNSYLPSSIYDKYLSIKDGKSRIKILVRDIEESITEIILLIQSENSLVTMGVYGKFTYNDLEKLADKINKKG
jgi:hypothetical protein